MTLEKIAELIVCIAGFWVSFSYHQRLKGELSRNPLKGLAEFHAQFNRKANTFFQKLALIQDHLEKYFDSLDEAGFSDLTATKNALLKVNDDIQTLTEEGNLEGVSELLTLLRNPVAKIHPKLAAYTSADLRYLEDWEKRTDDLIVAAVVKLGVMQSKSGYVDVGVPRRPTMYTLKDLQRTLSA